MNDINILPLIYMYAVSKIKVNFTPLLLPLLPSSFHGHFTMVKRRPIKGFDECSSSDDEEEDAFASLGKKGKKRPSASLEGTNEEPNISRQDSNSSKLTRQESTSSNRDGKSLPATETSSNKRHHHLSLARKSKMDAMLADLQSSQPLDITANNSHGYNSNRGYQEDYGPLEDESNAYGYNYGRPNKLGSYVEPGKEHLTTNIFVGNLDPCTTEEELTDVFREFGEDILCSLIC